MARKRIVGPWRFGKSAALDGAAPARGQAAGTAEITGKALAGAASGRGLAAGALSVSAPPPPPPPPGLTLTLDSTAGNGTHLAGALYWQSAFATNDGTLIHWGTGDHNPSADNGVREYNLVNETESYVYPNNNGTIDQSQYDNLVYWYIPRFNMLALPPRGTFVRGSNVWTRGNLQPSWNTGNRTLGTDPQCLIYQDASVDYTELAGMYNSHLAWSAQFDAGVCMGGGLGGDNTTKPSMWIIVDSRRRGSFAQPYHVIKRSMPSNVGGAVPYKHHGRDGACFAGDYLYWVGGSESINYTPTAHFFRMRFSPHLNSTSAPLDIERLPDAPTAHSYGLLRYIPMAGVLVLINAFGFATFDLTTWTWSSWSSLTSTYAAFFGSYGMPANCNGDYVHTVGGALRREVAWRPGQGDNWSGAPGSIATKYFKLRVTRGNDVSYLDISVAHPENPAANYGNLFSNMKHQNIVAYGSGASRKMLMFSGDWTGYPYNMNTTPGYKPEGVYGDSGRQELWEADISDSAVASGSIRWSMVSNAYAKYPWTGSAGYYASAQKGPRASDSLGMVRDNRGQWWMGPCDYNDYLDAFPEIAGDTQTYAPMFQWTKPGLNNTAVTGAGVNGVALGNGWTLPNQDRLYRPGSGGTLGVHYDVSFSGAGDSFAWGRNHAKCTVYDSTNDRIYVLSVGTNASAKQFSVQLYEFDPTPAGYAANGNKYKWTKKTLQTRNCKDFGGLLDSQYTGINMSGWGDNAKGTIAVAPQMIGRNIYFVACWGYTGLSGVSPNRPEVGAYTKAHMMSINVDTLAMEWIPFPAEQNWWERAWDGANSVAAGAAGHALTAAIYRNMCCIGDKLVLGPDSYMKIGVDPLVCVYNTTNKTWNLFNPSTDHDIPQCWDNFIGVPDLGEVWVIGSQPAGADTFRDSNGLWNCVTNAGRRVVRIKIQ